MCNFVDKNIAKLAFILGQLIYQNLIVIFPDARHHTCPRVKIKGGGNFRSSEGGEGGTRVPRGDLLNRIWINGGRPVS